MRNLDPEVLTRLRQATPGIHTAVEHFTEVAGKNQGL